MDVFVIDDDFGIREFLIQALEDEGLKVESAVNGKEAFDQLRRRSDPPCVILLDLMMPVMDGWEFRAEQQQDTTLAAIPVVILSARPDIEVEAAQLGVDSCLSKPVDLQQLVDIVRRYCHS